MSDYSAYLTEIQRNMKLLEGLLPGKDWERALDAAVALSGSVHKLGNICKQEIARKEREKAVQRSTIPIAHFPPFN